MKRNSGVIKQILKDHFDGYWKMYSNTYPESYRIDIKEAVETPVKHRDGSNRGQSEVLRGKRHN